MRDKPNKRVLLSSIAVLLMAGYCSAQTIKTGTKYCVQRFGQREFSLLLKDLSPDSKNRLASDPDLRRKQVENMRQLLALACEAEKRGLASEETNAAELENIGSQVVAMNYDKRVNKTGAQPFSSITDAQIAAFYKTPSNETAFGRFLKSNANLLRRGNSEMANHVISDDEKAVARDFFAKIKISEAASQQKRATPGSDLAATDRLQMILQQTQFLASALSDKMAPEFAASDAEVAAYIGSHPEFDVAAKKTLAAEVLAKAKAGEDFAGLANKYSEDPGNNGPDGAQNGGLYKNVSKGTMVPPFENAALSLKPGAVYPDLVESDFGFHIIKLENRVGTAGDTKYDVRHILISTMVKDPANPNTRDMPIRDYVRAKIEDEKESVKISQIVAANPVAIDDLVVNPSTTAKTTASKPTARKPAVRKTRIRKGH